MNLQFFSNKPVRLASLLAWAIFVTATIFVPPLQIFHIFNPLIISFGLILLLVFSPVLIDFWNNRDKPIDPAHLLAFGIIFNWVGLVLRLVYRHATNFVIPTDTLGIWVYNYGIFTSLWASIFLIASVQLSTPKYKTSFLIVIWLLITCTLWWWDIKF